MIAFAILFAACFIMLPYFLTWRTRRRSAAPGTAPIIAGAAQFVRALFAVFAFLGAAAIVLGLFVTGDTMDRITLVLVVGFGLTIFAVCSAAGRIVKQMEKSREALLEAMTELRGSH